MQRLGCCRRDRGMSVDTDEDEKTTMNSGMVDGMFKRWSLDSGSGSTATRMDGFCTDSLSLDEDDSSCSSGKDPFGSFSARWSMRKPNEELLYIPSPLHCKDESNGKKLQQPLQWEDVDMMKERFAKLLLGEDMSGGSKGVSTALALSNAITNLSASVFGELWKLEPLAVERKAKWFREMDWLLSPASYMVELVPGKQNYTNGKTIEIMTPRPRSDIQINLPALGKLDAMLIESLDGIDRTEFWYTEDGSGPAENVGVVGRKPEGKKWWLPIPRIPEDGLSNEARKKLLYQRDSVSQIFKAAKSINEQVLSEMDVPDVYWDSLPKTGKASLGDSLYKLITTDYSSIESALSSLNLSTEHSVLETANRLEAAIYTWKRRIQSRNHVSVDDGKSVLMGSWSLVKESEAELWKKEHYMERAENILLHLKNKYPSMPQTFLDITKIQYNKDVGFSILESYSRVLESLAFNILSRINDIICQDDFVQASKRNPHSSLAGDADDDVSVRTPSAIFPSLRKSITWNLDCCRIPSANSSPATSPSHMETPKSQFQSQESAKLGVFVEQALFSYIKRESCLSESSEYKDACDEILASGRKSSTAVSPRGMMNSWCYGRESCTSSP